MQYVIWCVICGIITAGSLCAALGAEKRARDAEKLAKDAVEDAERKRRSYDFFFQETQKVHNDALEHMNGLWLALKNETAERARIERASCGVLEKNEALERRVEELEAELAKKQKVLDYIADAEKEDAV